jgi:hypothetical protein
MGDLRGATALPEGLCWHWDLSLFLIPGDCDHRYTYGRCDEQMGLAALIFLIANRPSIHFLSTVLYLITQDFYWAAGSRTYSNATAPLKYRSPRLAESRKLTCKRVGLPIIGIVAAKLELARAPVLDHWRPLACASTTSAKASFQSLAAANSSDSRACE